MTEAAKALGIGAQACLRYAKFLELPMEKRLHPKSHHNAYWLPESGYIRLREWLDKYSWSERRQQARKKYDLEVYGVEYYNNREKDRRTKLERYGDEHYCNGAQISRTLRAKPVGEKKAIESRRSETKLERYGDEKYNNSRKAAETNLKRYGATSPAKNKNVLEKAKRTNLKKYGTEWPQQNSRFIEERYERWGCYSPHFRYVFEGVYFDSYWELCYYVYQKKILDRDIRRGKVFEYFADGKKHRYECDFLLEGENIEIKGDQFFNEVGELRNIYTGELQKEKESCMKMNNVRILSKGELAPIIKLISEKYPNLKEETCISRR